MPNTKIRNDGKPARASIGGTPAGSPRPADLNMAARDREHRKLHGKARTGTDGWPVLGPIGEAVARPMQTLARRAALGQLIRHEPSRVQVPEGPGQRRARRMQRRADGRFGENHYRLHFPRRRAQSTIPPR